MDNTWVKPKVSEIAHWATLYTSPKVQVHQGSRASGSSVNPVEFYRVTPAGKRPKYFWGESAWCNAERYACDFDFDARRCTSVR